MTDIFDHYWFADDGRIFSSRRAALVALDDADFVKWKEVRQATPWPRDEAGAQTARALVDVLARFGLPGPPAPPTREEARAECARRITAVASLEAQMNIERAMRRLAKKPTPTADETADLANADALDQWITAMRATWKTLLAAGDVAFRTDAKWPTCPETARALAAKY